MSVTVKPISECLTVAELLATPSRWIKGLGAVDSDGHGVDSASPGACRFCLFGAVMRIYPRTFKTVTGQISDALNGGNEIAWNDAEARTHSEVLALVTRLGL